MNQERIGKFIAELRKENNMTQEELAQKISISRQAVSKWERGVSIPNSDILLILSNLFKVSVNEILIGERINETNKEKTENLSLKLYDNMNKNKKAIKWMGIIIILLLFLFFSYYFINTYKKVKIYTVTGESENYVLTDGIFIKTNEKVYLSLGGEIFSKYDNIQKIALYYVDSNNEKNLLQGITQSSIQIVDYRGYNAYFDFDKLNDMINNLILEVTNENGEVETLKLIFIEDYISDLKTIFSKKDKSYTKNDWNNYSSDYDDTINLKGEYQKLEEKIFEKFEKSGDGYVYTMKKNNLKYDFFYDDFTRLNITIFKENKIIEEYNYILKWSILNYNNYENGTNFEIQNGNMNCLTGDCKNYKEILQKYEEIFNNM